MGYTWGKGKVDIPYGSGQTWMQKLLRKSWLFLAIVALRCTWLLACFYCWILSFCSFARVLLAVALISDLCLCMSVSARVCVCNKGKKKNKVALLNWLFVCLVYFCFASTMVKFASSQDKMILRFCRNRNFTQWSGSNNWFNSSKRCSKCWKKCWQSRPLEFFMFGLSWNRVSWYIFSLVVRGPSSACVQIVTLLHVDTWTQNDTLITAPDTNPSSDIKEHVIRTHNDWWVIIRNMGYTWGKGKVDIPYGSGQTWMQKLLRKSCLFLAIVALRRTWLLACFYCWILSFCSFARVLLAVALISDLCLCMSVSARVCVCNKGKKKNKVALLNWLFVCLVYFCFTSTMVKFASSQDKMILRLCRNRNFTQWSGSNNWFNSSKRCSKCWKKCWQSRPLEFFMFGLSWNRVSWYIFSLVVRGQSSACVQIVTLLHVDTWIQNDTLITAPDTNPSSDIKEHVIRTHNDWWVIIRNMGYTWGKGKVDIPYGSGQTWMQKLLRKSWLFLAIVALRCTWLLACFYCWILSFCSFARVLLAVALISDLCLCMSVSARVCVCNKGKKKNKVALLNWLFVCLVYFCFTSTMVKFASSQDKMILRLCRNRNFTQWSGSNNWFNSSKRCSKCWKKCWQSRPLEFFMFGLSWNRVSWYIFPLLFESRAVQCLRTDFCFKSSHMFGRTQANDMILTLHDRVGSSLHLKGIRLL